MVACVIVEFVSCYYLSRAYFVMNTKLLTPQCLCLCFQNEAVIRACTQAESSSTSNTAATSEKQQ
uniref:Uncharacterized protein n=1 Tax=Hordeum vulgare subsp. vulgare TaxID=112509 RepID=A0A8I6XYT3_HORVV